LQRSIAGARASAVQTLVIAQATPHTKPMIIVLTTGLLAKFLEPVWATDENQQILPSKPYQT